MRDHRRVARVVVNPQASRAGALPTLDFGPDIRAIVDIAESESVARAIVRDAVSGDHLVVVAGGDGSIHAAVNAIAAEGAEDGGVAVGVVPLGTANDLARELGMPACSLEAAWRVGDGSARAQDALVVNDHRAVVGGGFGLPALCIETVQALRARSGLGAQALRQALRHTGGRAYQAAAPLHVFPRPPHIGVDVCWVTPEGDERRWQTHVIAGFFLNQRTIGRGLLLAPDAVRDDGCFELAFIMPSSSPKLLRGLWRVSVGKDAPGQVVVIRARRATLQLDDAQMVFVDGEDIGVIDTVDVIATPRRAARTTPWRGIGRAPRARDPPRKRCRAQSASVRPASVRAAAPFAASRTRVSSA